MPSTTQSEWLNENSLRAYPFFENSTRIPNDGSEGLLSEAYALPNYFIVDALVSVPYEHNEETFFVSSVTLAGGVATVTLSAVLEDNEAVVGSVSIATSSPTNSVAKFVGSGEYDGVYGAVVFGDLARFDSNYPDGIFNFDDDQTTLEPRCVRPSIRCVSGITAMDQDLAHATRTLYGKVGLIAGSNVKLTYMEELNAIKIDVRSDAGYNEKCDCDGTSSRVKTINGISISDVLIEGGDCISVETSDGRISISDTCAKPCCGCEELNFLNTKSNEIVTSLTRLSSFVETLQDKMNDFKTNFLESERSPIKTV